MKRRNLSFITAMLIIFALLTACGGKSTQEPADQQKPKQEAVESSDQQKPKQEESNQSDQQESTQEESNQDVKHWKIQKGQLLGQTDPEEFIVLADLPTDSGIRDYAKVVSSSEANDMLLIEQDCAFYRFDLKSNKATLINSGAYDSRYDSYADVVNFVRPDGAEYVVDWKTADIEATGNYRTNYNVCPNNYEVAGFDEFTEIQEAVKNGDYNVAFDKGYIVEANGNIYDFKNHYITNVHLPAAYAGNIYTATAGDVATLIKDGKLNFYRFGEELSTIELPSGSFVVVDLFLQTNGNDASALLFNFDDRSLYKAENGSVKIVFSDVKDYFAPKDGHVFWVDSDNSGHVCNWYFDQNDSLVAEDITGVSHYRDFPGFVVDESKGEEFNGLHILVY